MERQWWTQTCRRCRCLAHAHVLTKDEGHFSIGTGIPSTLGCASALLLDSEYDCWIVNAPTAKV